MMITRKLLKQGYRYHKLRRTLSWSYKRYEYFLNKYNSTLKHSIAHPLIYGHAVYALQMVKTSP